MTSGWVKDDIRMSQGWHKDDHQGQYDTQDCQHQYGERDHQDHG